MKKQTKATIFALLAVLCWSTVATAFKIALSTLSLLELLFYASIFSTLSLLLILLLSGKFFLLKETKLRDIFSSILLSILNPLGYYLILFKAYDLLPAQEALTLNYTWAIVVVILSIPLLQQKIKLLEFFALLISFLGVVVIATHGNPFDIKLSNTLGVFLAIISSVVWATFWIFNLKDKRDSLVKLFWNFLFGSIFISIIMFYYGEFSINWQSLLPALYIGLFEMSIAFYFWLLALKYSESTVKVSNLIYLSPFLSLIVINIVLGEQILISTFIGLSLIIFGIILQQLIKKAS
jgi:drug/metabolite transporter (DMT)-like permease